MVLLLLPPSVWNEADGLATCLSDQIPALAIHLFGALRQAKLPVEVLDLDHRFHGSHVGFEQLATCIRDVLEASSISHVVIPISSTESYNEFRNIDIALLRRLLELPWLKERSLVLCGRVLSERRLRDEVPGDYQVAPVSYDDGRAVVTAVLGKEWTEPTRVAWDESLEEAFHLSEVWDARHADDPVVIVGQRGCPYTCSFCERVLIWPQNQVVRSDPTQAAEAMRFFRTRYDRHHAMVLDPIFNLQDRYVHEFCQQVQGLDVRWHAEMRVDRVKPDQLREMREAGCYRILFGVESFDNEVASKIHKPVHPAAVRAAVDMCQSAGIEPWLSFMVGLGDSVRQAYRAVTKTADTLLQLGLKEAHAVPYFMYSGTRAYVARFGREDDGVFPLWYLPFPLPVMVDLLVLFANRQVHYETTIGEERASCLLDVGRAIERGARWEVASAAAEELAVPSNRQEICRELWTAREDRIRELSSELVRAWDDDAPAARVDFTSEAKRLGLTTDSISRWG